MLTTVQLALRTAYSILAIQSKYVHILLDQSWGEELQFLHAKHSVSLGQLKIEFSVTVSNMLAQIQQMQSQKATLEAKLCNMSED